MNSTIVISGAESAAEVPGIEKLPDGLKVRYVTREEEVAEAVDGADVAFGWGFDTKITKVVWRAGKSLRWLHWCGSGIDALADEDLINSEVIFTSSRGTVSRAMAEYTLGLILAFAKRLPSTVRSQTCHDWQYQLNEQLLGCSVLVIGVGSIGREIGLILSAFGLEVDGMGRSRRESDPDFRKIYAIAELDARLAHYDYVVVIVPSTTQTQRLIGAKQFALMKPTARLINLSRGSILDESALVDALETGQIAGAGLDVFETEPLPSESPLWDMDNVIVSPHVSGVYQDYEAVVVDLFVENVRRYIAHEPLLNTINKSLGFVPGNCA